MRYKNTYTLFFLIFSLASANVFATERQEPPVTSVQKDCPGAGCERKTPSRWIVAYKSKQTSVVLKGIGHDESGKVFNLSKRQETEVITNVLALARKMSSPDVAYIEKDTLMQAVAETFGSPNDPLYTSQWQYNDSIAGISLAQAWNITQGQNPINVAIVDTGILPHPDLVSKTLPGFDMVSDSFMGNDGNGRDSDPTDSGDWVYPGDACYTGRTSNSSWHGTHVAGSVGAQTNNGVGVAGVNPGARIIPVRVLGKCGGYTSDIIDGIRWAAGLSVSGAPINSNPARVINLSLGAPGNCTRAMQEAINEARAKGALLVVAAGNSGVNIDYQNFSPANCAGVVTVGASTVQGSKAYYSNYGTRLDIMAPGGDSWAGILSTSNDGYTTSGGNSYKTMSGTSMATPHITGVISLMLSINPGLVPSQLVDILKSTADSMPTSFGCENRVCGAGLVNAFEAVSEARITSPASKDNYVPSLPNEGASQNYNVQSSKGGGCGTIDLNGNGSGGSGGPFVFSMMVGMMAMVLLGQSKKNKKASK